MHHFVGPRRLLSLHRLSRDGGDSVAAHPEGHHQPVHQRQCVHAKALQRGATTNRVGTATRTDLAAVEQRQLISII